MSVRIQFIIAIGASLKRSTFVSGNDVKFNGRKRSADYFVPRNDGSLFSF